ncbi:hypothetical protein GCM10010278_84160 [Streptomyces melanogenes]|nr:hypothetical protein GCM10010278_84160 [Streptomyces melanogenes]
MRRARISLAATALTTLALLLSPALAAPARAAAPEDTVTLPVRDALQNLPVRAEDRTGYERTKFKHWVDADRDGCNTRAEVLKIEALEAPVQGPKCALTGGSWYSPYDNQYFDDARKLDIDHLVPLAEAWDSGASAWSAAEREAYANDLDAGFALIAVSAASNRSKADQDPSTWLPPYTDYRCQYVTDWIADKTRWASTSTPPNKPPWATPSPAAPTSTSPSPQPAEPDRRRARSCAPSRPHTEPEPLGAEADVTDLRWHRRELKGDRWPSTTAAVMIKYVTFPQALFTATRAWGMRAVSSCPA